MSTPDSRAPNQKITDEEVHAAVQEICNKRGVPVVRSKDIIELDWVNVGRQAINNHLENLEEENKIKWMEVGGQKTRVWWVPEDADEAGEVDVSAINWDEVDPGEIPEETIKQRPEVEDPTYWEGVKDSWSTIGGGGLFFFVIGFILFAVADYSPFEFSRDLQTTGAFITLAGMLIFVGSLVMILGARFGQFLEDMGVLPRVRNKIHEFRNSALRAIERQLASEDEDT